MRSRGLVLLVLAAAIVIAAFLFWPRAKPPVTATQSSASTSRQVAKAPAPLPPVFDASAKLATLAQHVAPDSVSPIANELNAPNGTIRHDLEVLDQVFGAWQTNFPGTGNPVGENNEITVALAGDNSLHFAFISPRHPAINAQGELCDRWGTPFFFHQLSGTQMEIHSAGPDRKFGTADDVVWPPAR